VPISQIKTICEISVREWSIRRFLVARMDFFSVILELFVLFYYIILLFITQVKYPAAIVLVMISKISLI
jgi:hypothetical protein